MKEIYCGVTAPKGFKACGVSCGIKKNNAKDLALIVSDNISVAAGTFTTNTVKGHSLKLTMENIKSKYAKAFLVNSGNANACVGSQGDEDAKNIIEYLSQKLNCNTSDIILNSTGVIGIRLDVNKIKTGIDSCLTSLDVNGGTSAAQAIMTTDTFSKELAVEIEIEGKKAVIGGMAKGSGMIHPNMATMIGAITTDVKISPKLLDKSLKQSVYKTFNRTSVDGDTSVCDMVTIMANGMSDVEITESNMVIFNNALDHICTYLAKSIAKDGEGATKLIEIIVHNAKTAEDAYKMACSIAKSPLVKTAIFGEDANWGRILTAAGYSGADFNPELINILIGNLTVCENGNALSFDEEEALRILKNKEVQIVIDLKQGSFSDRMWTCDFSYDYVKINGSYRT